MEPIGSIFGPITTLTVGGAVVLIAWQQWKVARNKLRLDLYDRRYKVYDATRKFLAVIQSHAAFSDSQLFEFYAGTSDVEFLFDADVVEFLTQIPKNAIEMRKHQKVYEHLPVGDGRSRHVQADHDQSLRLGEQFTAMTKTFTPYLGFSHIK